MTGYVVTKGCIRYTVSAQDHAINLAKVSTIPKVLTEIDRIGRRFHGKPQFEIHQTGTRIVVAREDYQDKLSRLIAETEGSFVGRGERYSLSEWNEITLYKGDYNGNCPITMHDVFAVDDITIKTGNPYRNNSWEEFINALRARSLGVVEAKSPLGFVYWLDDLYGAYRPGIMFYKNINGNDLETILAKGNIDLINWALWEAGKFFSRLINAQLYLEDSDRLGNYFIEDNLAAKVFRFLDMEYVFAHQDNGTEKAAQMLMRFCKKALQRGFLTPEKIGEFLIVCVGAHLSADHLIAQLMSEMS